MILIASFIGQLLMSICTVDGANILGIALYDGNSHWLVMKSVFKALEDAGHNITVITPYPRVDDTNFTVIDVSKILPPRTNSFDYDLLLKEYHNPLRTFHALPNLSLGQCDKAHGSREIKEILKYGHNFDLVISEVFGTDCDAVFAHLLKVPLISVVTSTLLPWANDRVGNPQNPSHVSNIMLPYSDQMSFEQRVVNVFYYLYSSMSTWYYNRVTTSLNRKHFGNQIPPVEDILRKTSLIFVNSHFSVDISRPYMPNIVEIGGIHLKPTKPLPEDLAQILDDSKHGVIYFSLGSVLRASSLPNETINALREAFAELEYTVLWKFEDEDLNVSSNVLVRKWFPQRDILAHKNLKLVIMHGGLMGVYETIDVGVPAIGLPVFFDQQRNIQNLVSKGAALRLQIDKITKNHFLESIRRVIEDRRFKQQAEKLSQRFHDRLVQPSKSVVYWTEYVINYGGANHLMSGVTQLYWFQAINLDVFFLYFLIILTVSYMLKKMSSTFLNFIQKTVAHPCIPEKQFQNGTHKNGSLRNGAHLKVN